MKWLTSNINIPPTHATLVHAGSVVSSQTLPSAMISAEAAYVPSPEYGFVEISHLTLCHAILDLAMGWGAQADSEQAAE